MNKISKQTLSLFSLLVCVSILYLACGGETPTQPVINIFNTNTNTNGNTNNNGQVSSPSASPSPGSAGQPTQPPAGVKVRFFAGAFSTCPGEPSTVIDNRSLKVGCSAPITCTPYKADGSDYWAGIPDALISAPDQFAPLQNTALVSMVIHSTGNGYNADVTCKSSGAVPIGCVVKGITSLGSGDTFAVNCIN